MHCDFVYMNKKQWVKTECVICKQWHIYVTKCKIPFVYMYQSKDNPLNFEHIDHAFVIYTKEL